MPVRIFVPWIVLVGILGFALGGSYVWAFLDTKTVAHHQNANTKESDSNGHPTQEKEDSDAAIARYTFWLMIFAGVLAVATVGLGVATYGLFLTGERQIGLVGDQVKLASDAFNATHRPRLKIHSITFTRQAPAESINEEVITARVHYASFGEQEAVIHSIRFRFAQYRTPLESGIEFDQEAHPSTVPIKGGMRGWFRVSAERLVKTAKISTDARSRFFFIGAIFYRGPRAADPIRELGFCRVLECDAQGCRWETHENPEYEYSY